ncbi:MAG: mannose-1-phosphate guanylyltransferase [Thermoguttaceae bacterium]
MRYALIIAGGSGTRLWPMSRGTLPKQLIPFISGKSLLEIAYERLEGLVPAERRYICAGEKHARVILNAIPGLLPEQFLGEPTGRDTVNAVGFGAAVIARHDPDAVIAIFTADHIIRPIDRFQEIIAQGFEVAETHPETLVTFGIAPTQAATGYGYLELGERFCPAARVVERFKEKPDEATAKSYFAAGPERYLWNSGMFVWRAQTLLDCLGRFEPAVAAGVARVAEAWDSAERLAVLNEVYPMLRKVSVDFAVMEPASRDPNFRVAAIPMPLEWLDIGSWPMFAETCPHDEQGNALAAQRHVLVDSQRTLVASSDSRHVIAAIGCEDLIIIHTPDATLVCRADRAEEIKSVYGVVGERFGDHYL